MSYECRGMNQSNLLYIIEQKKLQTFVPAPWQRDDIWTPEKKEEFRKTIEYAKCGEVMLEGSMMTYHLFSEKGRGYGPPTVFNDAAIPAKINDGMQRTYTAEQIFDDMLSKEGTEEGRSRVRTLFMRVGVYLQYYIYDTEEEAQTSFLRVNYGTGMTNYERGRTILVSHLKPFDAWLKLLQELHSIMENGVSFFEIKTKLGRNDQHKCLRDDMALFLRYISGDLNTTNYRSACKVELIDFTSVTKKKALLEYSLCEYLNDMGLAGAKEKMSEFRTFVENQTKIMKEVWGEIDKSDWEEDGPIDTVTMTNYRWVLALAIYCKNNRIPFPRYRELLKGIYLFSHGATEFANPKNVRNKFQLGLSNLTSLANVQKLIGYQMNDKLVLVPKRDKINTEQIARGNHAAHKLPYSVFDNGPVVSKPALDNLSSGTSINADDLVDIDSENIDNTDIDGLDNIIQ